jgi:hypothetical protein
MKKTAFLAITTATKFKVLAGLCPYRISRNLKFSREQNILGLFMFLYLASLDERRINHSLAQDPFMENLETT